MDELDRTTAAEALANMGAKTAIPGLKEAMRVEEKVYVKVNMADALVILGDFMSAEYLVNLIKSPFTDQREWARNTLVEISEQDFGYDYAAWRKWFEEEKKKRGL